MSRGTVKTAEYFFHLPVCLLSSFNATEKFDRRLTVFLSESENVSRSACSTAPMQETTASQGAVLLAKKLKRYVFPGFKGPTGVREY